MYNSKLDYFISISDGKNRFCLQWHDELTDGHKKINIEDHRVQSSKLDIRTCEEHKDQPYSLGCKVCLTLICMRCLPELDVCGNGKGGWIVFPSLPVRTLYVMSIDEWLLLRSLIKTNLSCVPNLVKEGLRLHTFVACQESPVPCHA